jgi:predicted transcriptional regulator
MKHVIITLPLKQWEEIVAGRKLFELRKSIPLIHPFSGRVYVVIKGTLIVKGYFTVSGIVGSDDIDYLWDYCDGNLGISKEDYLLYASQMYKCLYAWEIDSVYEYNKPIDIEFNFGILYNPRDIAWTTAEPSEETIRVRGDQLTQSFFSRNFVMPVSLYYRGSWYDRIPEKTYDESELEKAIQ